MARPEMVDPADTDIHSGSKPRPAPADDLTDPSNMDPKAPHDRGSAPGNRYKGAREDMDERLGEDVEDWKKGRTQNG